MSSFLSKRSGSAGGNAPGEPFSWGSWGSRYPAVAEFLSAEKWPDGTPRTPGTLTIFVDGLAWKACLSDKAQGLVAFVTGSDPDVLLDAAERGLVANVLDWRSSKPGGRRQR